MTERMMNQPVKRQYIITETARNYILTLYADGCRESDLYFAKTENGKISLEMKIAKLEYNYYTKA